MKSLEAEKALLREEIAALESFPLPLHYNLIDKDFMSQTSSQLSDEESQPERRKDLIRISQKLNGLKFKSVQKTLSLTDRAKFTHDVIGETAGGIVQFSLKFTSHADNGEMFLNLEDLQMEGKYSELEKLNIILKQKGSVQQCLSTMADYVPLFKEREKVLEELCSLHPDTVVVSEKDGSIGVVDDDEFEVCRLHWNIFCPPSSTKLQHVLFLSTSHEQFIQHPMLEMSQDRMKDMITHVGVKQTVINVISALVKS